MPMEDLERRYLERARRAVGERATGIRVVLPDRSPPPDGPGTALAGWWADEQADGGAIVLPNPYELDLLTTMEARVWEIVQRMSARVGAELDRASGRPPRDPVYWHTMLAPWLVHVTSALADRRLFCLTVAHVTPQATLLLGAVPDPPATMAESVKRLRTDAGNAGLLAAIAPKLGLSCAPHDVRVELPAPIQGLSRAQILRLLPQAALAGLIGRLPHRRVAIIGLTRVTGSDLLRLEGAVGGVAPLPRRVPPRRPPTTAAADLELRAQLEIAAAADPLEALVAELLPYLLPISVLEGLRDTERTARRRYGRPLPSLVGNYSPDEVQNDFLGRCRGAGLPLAFAQHGGMYFQSPVNAQERLEITDDSVFLSWGARRPGVLPTPNPHLERLRDTHVGGSRITIVESLEPPDTFLLRFAGHPQGNQAYEPRRALTVLVQRLSPGTRANLVLRRFPSPVAVPARPPQLRSLPHDGPAGGATAWMATSRMAIVPYLDTPFIEALVIGTPTVGLWNAAHWPLLAEVQRILERMRAAGIVHHDPVAAAQHVDAVYEQVDRWWDRDDVVAARRLFLERFAVDGSWLSAWSDRLRELKTGGAGCGDGCGAVG